MTTIVETTGGSLNPNNISISGTGGTGFIYLPTQSSAPSNPTSGINIYGESTAFAWKQDDGFVRRFVSTGASSDITYTIPTSNITVVGTTSSDTLTNKTITDATNNIAANSLKTTGSAVIVSGASAPTTGQVLTATSSTTADWATPVSGSKSLEIPYPSTLVSSNATTFTAGGTLWYPGSTVATLTRVTFIFGVNNNSSDITLRILDITNSSNIIATTAAFKPGGAGNNQSVVVTTITNLSSTAAIWQIGGFRTGGSTNLTLNSVSLKYTI